MPSPRSLVIVSKSLAPYRVNFYREVARELSTHGWRTTLIVALAGARDHPWLDSGKGDSTLNVVEVRGRLNDAKAWTWLKGKLKLPPDAALPGLRLYDELGASMPDIVWTHEYSPFCLAAALWASWKERISVLSTDIGNRPPAYACSRRGLIFHRTVSFLHQAVIAQTKEATRRTEPAGAPILLAPHAIDTDAYHPRTAPRQDGPFRFLFTGSLDDRKGIRRLVEAGRILAARGREFELRILGSGPLSSWLARQPEPWITVPGFLEGEALRREYREADAYVLPTNGDTYAVTVHEAAASGLPLIVGRNAGAVETLLDDATSGFVIESEAPEEIAGHMSKLLDDPELVARLGRAARVKAERYDVRLLAKQTAGFLMDLAGSGTGHPATTPSLAGPAPVRAQPTTPPAASVAAVFATMNRAEVAAECVRRLGAGLQRPGKVFITDNASTDPTCDLVRSASAETDLPCRIIRSGSNLGNAGGVKLAVEAAIAEGFEAVWILDDDSWPEAGSLAGLLDGELPQGSIRSSLVLAPDSDEVSWASEVPGPDGGWRSLEHGGDLPVQGWSRLRRSWLGSLIPAEVYADAGPLIGELFLRGEDEEYPRRLERLGYQFWISPRSVLRHPVGGPYVNLAFRDYRICLERNLSGNKLYYRIRNLIWIKMHEAGAFSALVLAAGILFLVLLHFRPLIPALCAYREAFGDAFSDRLGPRSPSPR